MTTKSSNNQFVYCEKHEVFFIFTTFTNFQKFKNYAL